MSQTITLTTEQLDRMITLKVEQTLAQLGVIPALVTRAEMIRISGSVRLTDYLIKEGYILPVQDNPNSTKTRYDRVQFLTLLKTNQKAKKITRKNKKHNETIN